MPLLKNDLYINVSPMTPTILPGIYQHYKGMRYQVLDVARSSETLEPLVVYRALFGDSDLWIRPAAMFSESVMVDDKKVPRFKFIETVESRQVKTYVTVVECAIEHNGKFLIIKRQMGVHAAGLLAFPGGKVEARDELNNYAILGSALKREVLEEVGLVLEDQITYVTSSYFVDSNGHHVINSVFHCILDKTTVNVIPSEREVPEYYWMTQSEINDAKNAPEWLKRYTQLVVETNS